MALLSARRLLERISAGERLISDGAIGSELIRYGIAPEDVLRANLGLSGEVQSVHSRYLSAGADLLTSNTFGLRDGDEWATEIRAGMGLAIHAARESDREVGVWLSLPGSVVPRELESLRFLATHNLLWSRSLLIETCTSLAEAVEAARSGRLLAPEVLAVTAHFCADGCMPDGTSPERFARALEAEGADLVGANCGEIPETFVTVTARLRSATQKPLLVQPSAGIPIQDAAGHWTYPQTPEQFADLAERLFEEGAGIVGGCCGVSPAHIAALCIRAAS